MKSAGVTIAEITASAPATAGPPVAIMIHLACVPADPGSAFPPRSRGKHRHEGFELGLGDRHEMLLLRIGAALDVGPELAKGGDPFVLQAVVFRPEVAIDLGVAGAMMAGEAEHVLREEILRVGARAAPIDKRTSDVRFEISAPTRAGTTSSSAPTAPAASSAFT